MQLFSILNGLIQGIFIGDARKPELVGISKKLSQLLPGFEAGFHQIISADFWLLLNDIPVTAEHVPQERFCFSEGGRTDPLADAVRF